MSAIGYDLVRSLAEARPLSALWSRLHKARLA